MAKLNLPIGDSSTANAAALGYRRGDKFFAAPTIAERAFLVNKNWAPKLRAWKPAGKHRLRILVIHGQALAEYRLTTPDRYRNFEAEAKHEPKFIDEEWLDREHFAVYQLFVNFDITGHITVARLCKFIENWTDLGKQFFILLQNSLGELFQLNDKIAPEYHTHREFTGNVLGHTLLMFRYHLKSPIAFVGFGCGIEGDAEGTLRIETMDTLRQRNRALMRDKIYVTDIVSYSASVITKPEVLTSWRHNRVRYTLANFAHAILEEWEEPYSSYAEAGSG
jgi:hypothetical protein